MLFYSALPSVFSTDIHVTVVRCFDPKPGPWFILTSWAGFLPSCVFKTTVFFAFKSNAPFPSLNLYTVLSYYNDICRVTQRLKFFLISILLILSEIVHYVALSVVALPLDCQLPNNGRETYF